MTKRNILYKYRTFSANSLSLLINRELYFSPPNKLNDPYDCRISILPALEAAMTHAETVTKKDIKSKPRKLRNLNNIFSNIEKDIRSSGIFSLSKDKKNTLMWSHYADEHRGFCLGFNLSRNTTEFNKDNLIVGSENVNYTFKNPFIDFFIDFAQKNALPDWDDFWIPLFIIGFINKSKPWKYEKEVRIIRKEPGTVSFMPEELVEVIFGLDMKPEHQLTIRNLLSGDEWDHIKFKEITKKDHNFKLYIKNLKSI